MKAAANIAIVFVTYAASLFGAYWLIYGPSPALSFEIAKWLWSPAALVVGSLTVLSWKVHETKRVEGLRSVQRNKLKRISGRIQRRLYWTCVIAALGALAGLLAAYLRAPFDAVVVCLAFSMVVGSFIVVLGLYPLTQRSIQKFEDAAREKIAADADKKRLLDRLKLDSPPSD